MFGKNALEISTSYRTFSAMHDAGNGLISSLELLKQSVGPKEQQMAHRLIHGVQRGSSLHGAMARNGFPPLETSLMKLAEQTGFMAETSKLLADYYFERYETERSIKWALLKPGLLLIISQFTFYLPSFVNGSISGYDYILRTLGLIGAAVGVLWWSFELLRRSSREPRLARKIHKLFQSVPVARDLMKTSAYERFFTAIWLSYRAGADLESMMKAAEDAANDDQLRAASVFIRRKGTAQGLAESFARTGIFRDRHLAAIRIGEQTGALEHTLEEVCKELRQEVRVKIARINEWLPKIIYGFACALIVFRILTSTTGPSAIP